VEEGTIESMARQITPKRKLGARNAKSQVRKAYKAEFYFKDWVAVLKTKEYQGA